jgi:hypothetical protein
LLEVDTVWNYLFFKFSQNNFQFWNTTFDFKNKNL